MITKLHYVLFAAGATSFLTLCALQTQWTEVAADDSTAAAVAVAAAGR